MKVKLLTRDVQSEISSYNRFIALCNQDWVARYYISMNAPKDKLNIGIALYGRTFTLNDPNRHDIGSPASQPGEAGQFTGEKGFVAYYEVRILAYIN